MLRKIFNGLVLLPLAMVVVIFAVANRHMATVSFDPFDSTDPALSLTMPLFLVILLAAIAGVAAGGAATWFRQRRWRRAARRHEAEARAARSQLDDSKVSRFASPLPSSNALLRPRAE
ncbi:lipopolysaccharide assembly protein LapA domain-containing protein [Bradyrhizobium sp. LHD-71]|uniref:lipopolysaccharide assembly protein LapA domain-containing protein n=1 Tax=Bradyrhizobium sp. LHD-71 TaxID=3072141 RepID=UPI00280DD53F|nr:lipopolysaccharide assembly protein LapA domain-containing protein [Bradyrhizobium sp. LHD-71]MDQ8731908.1 lipopolysaccharide assembly protein LapA domain-containing protein [Bradyrhizobium sp. LHD-71]